MATLKQIELGLPIPQAARQLGLPEQAFYRWKKLYAALGSDQVRECKVLQEENARLKRLVADRSLDKAILQDINSEENGPARAEASRSGLRRRSLRDEPAAGLPIGRSGSQRALLSLAAGSTDGASNSAAGIGTGADSLWVSPSAGAAAARGLVGGQEPGLSAVHRGRSAVA